MDHICDPHYFVAFGITHRLYDGWGRSYPAGHCHRRHPDPSYSGPKTIIAIWTLFGGGEVFGNEVGGRRSLDDPSQGEIYEEVEVKNMSWINTKPVGGTALGDWIRSC